ncbi:methyl-accepting chemotaxis protein [Aliikangiella sp. IMCC44359]|uniref:methyl-accepting chemotaxis protein n=1 Tax=Aliikangiella sp. IMCC44359 TaxID=3459125 RepID=UPI00403B01DA
MRSIANTNIPLSENVKQIHQYQTQQMYYFEKAMRILTAVENNNQKQNFQIEKNNFSELNRKIDNEIESGIKTTSIINNTTSEPKNKQLVLSIQNSFLKLKELHLNFKQQTDALFIKISNGENSHLESAIFAIESEGNKLEDFLNKTQNNISNLTNETINLAEVHEKNAEGLAGILMVLSIAIGLGASIYIGHRIGKRIKHIVSELNAVANGDLTRELVIEGNDEIGQLQSATLKMRDQLREILFNINKSSSTLSSASDELSSSINQTQLNCDKQHTETEQIATAIQQMTATVQEVALNINNTSKVIEKAKNDSDSGSEIINQSVSNVSQLAEQINDANEVISALSNDTNSINTVLEVIIGISEQTNLLALNAAIEAARAGESGRGFAVVADEVRTLAARTQDSTTEISHIIEKLHAGSQKAVQTINQSQEQASEVVVQANKAGDSFTSIASAISEINLMSSQIATAADEQISVSENISENITSISCKAAENSETSKKAYITSQSVSQMSVELSNLIQQFKVN